MRFLGLPTSDEQRASGGFNLIEVVVASGMLALTVGAMLHLGRVSVRSHDVSLERSRAYALAQESFEIIHALRDTQYHNQQINRPWNDDVWPANGSSMSPCWLADQQLWVLVRTDPIHCPEIIDGVEERSIDGITFRRSITILAVTESAFPPLVDASGTSIDWAAVARRFRVEVTWESAGDQFSITSETILTDWQPGF